MNANDVAGEGLGLVSRLAGAAISVPVVAGFVLLGAAVLVGRSLLDVGRKLLEARLEHSSHARPRREAGVAPLVAPRLLRSRRRRPPRRLLRGAIRAGHFLIRCAGRCAA